MHVSAIRRCVAAVACLSGAAALHADQPPAHLQADAQIIQLHGDCSAGVLIATDVATLRDRVAPGESVHIAAFPLTRTQAVDLRLERFSVATSDTQIVMGHNQQPIAFDPADVVLLRGTADGVAGSHVFMALSEHGCHGYLALDSQRRFAVTSRGDDGRMLAPGEALIMESRAAGNSLPPGVAMCGTDVSGWTGSTVPIGPGARGAPPIRGLRQIELAVETDYEYFVLFNDTPAAAAYIVSLYGAISDIYIRDVNTHITLSFVRLWDTPADLFNEPDPLQPFLEYWNANMSAVIRDTAQFCSGRRDLPAGGVAYLSGLCNSNSYSWGGYILGYFADPTKPDIFNRDVMVLAHEIGHNCNTPHTHDLGLDTCDDETTPPRRGTIMAYCGQTFTGGDANHDLWFHTTCQQIMESYINSRGCIARDCNRNGIPDATDIGAGTSLDVNANGVPDECEDANNNGVLDSIDIASGASQDRNNNQIPDEAEPDCNGNAIPDDLDFLPGSPVAVFSDNFENNLGWTVTNAGATSGDWQRGIPVNDPGWEYDPTSDADGSGRCYLTGNAAGNTDVDGGATRLTSPLLDLTGGGLSIGYSYFLRLTNDNGADRLLVEGSDNNGGTWQVLATHTSNNGLNWTANVISAAQIQAAGLLPTAQFRVRFTANDADPQSIVEAAVDAFYVGQPPPPPVSQDMNGNAIPDECEGDCDDNAVIDYAQVIADMSLDLNRNVILDSCEDCDNDGTPDMVELDHSHNVWIAASEKTDIREYFSKYGTQTLTSANGALQQPQDLIITPDRRILVTSRVDNRVAQFTIAGAYLGNLVAPGGGGLNTPAAMTISPSGTLLVVSRGTNSVLEYNASTGALVRIFVAAGAGGLVQPFGLAYGPSGNLFVTSNNGAVLEYNGSTGAFVGVFVSTEDNGGLNEPRGIVWNPRTGNLLVASSRTNQILEYDGTNGSFIRQWSQVGTATVLTFDQPWCLRVGPEGDIYASRNNMLGIAPGGSHEDHDHHDHDNNDYEEWEEHTEELHLSNARIYHFDADNGYFVRSLIMGVNSNISFPTGFDFVRDEGTDCNYNQRPDNCDIALGISADVNANGVPDECEILPCPGDLNGDRAVDIADLAILLSNFGTAGGAGAEDGDQDADGDIDLTDLSTFLSRFGTVCP